jgi:hypothetical protein
MSHEAVAVLEIPGEPAAKTRRGRRPAEQKQSEVQVLFYLGERSLEGRDLVLGERNSRPKDLQWSKHSSAMSRSIASRFGRAGLM